MFSPNSESDALAALIASDAEALTEELLKDILSEGRRQRSATYDVDSKALATRYGGDQAAVLKQALAARYPNSWQRLPVDPVGWLAFFARQDSGVYNTPAVRDLGEGVEDDDPRALAFAKALDDVAVDSLMLEAERRCATGTYASVIVLGYRQSDPMRPGKYVAHLYQPHDVVTVSHPSAPDDVDALVHVALRQARDGQQTASPVWWVWSRTVEERPDGTIARFGPWRHQRMSEDGKVATAPQEWPGRLPVAFLRTAWPAGGFWPEISRDTIANVDALNVSRANRQFVIETQAHAQLVVSGTTVDVAELPSGPDQPINLGAQAGATAQYLVPGADHEAIEASSRRDLAELGVAHGNSPDAYAVEPGPAESGVSRMIANIPHDQRIAEMRPTFQRFEEGQLLPIVVELINIYEPGVTIGDDVQPRCMLQTSKPFETDAEKQDRVLALVTAGLVTKPKAAVMLGLYADESEAEEALGMAGPRLLPGSSLSGSPFTQRETTPNPDGDNA